LNGAVTRAEANLAAIAAASAEARALVEQGELQARVEDKSACVALHFREMPAAADDVRRTASALAEKHGLSVLEGKMVAELTLGVRDKGDALTAFMREHPFRGRIPIAIGDDVTDEDAFSAARAAGGFGILVGDRTETHAQFALADARAVTRWLEARA
jgi:trehalose 6-phosphate phosphatase